jgi:hypothetical protein
MKTKIAVSLAFLLALSSSSCRRYVYVYLSPSKAHTHIAGGLQAYQGKRLNLGQFVNSASDTARYYFTGANYYILYYDYDGRVVEDLFRESFKLGLAGAGAQLVEDPGAPTMDVTLLSVTDNAFQFQVTIHQAGSKVVDKPFRVNGKPDHQQYSPDALEGNAHKMLAASVKGVLNDPDVQNAIASLGVARATAPPPAAPAATPAAPAAPPPPAAAPADPQPLPAGAPVAKTAPPAEQSETAKNCRLRVTGWTLLDCGCVNGFAAGLGRARGADGSEYVGYFSGGVFSGKGKVTFANGDSYDGNWNNGVMDGQGTYLRADGGKYIGQMRNGMFDGPGVYVYPDGNKITGVWRQGRLVEQVQ